MTKKYCNINNNKKKRNANDNGNNNDNVRFLITKTVIIAIMDELVIIIITVIKLAYTRNSMKKKEINKLDLIKELRIEIFFIINATNTKRKC